MGTGIVVCVLNGVGKSTLGRKLASRLGFYFIDNEDLYFPKVDSGYRYASPRTRREAEELFFRETAAHGEFVLAAVKGDYGDGKLFQYAVLLEAPKDVRMRRIRRRSFEKFGERMLAGGDLYEREEGFFRLVQGRPEHMAEAWAEGLGCPVLRLDGTRPVSENLEAAINWLSL